MSAMILELTDGGVRCSRPAVAERPAPSPDRSPSGAPAVPANDRQIFETLVHSKTYQQYERAFSETTGLPVTFRPVDAWQLPFQGRKCENPFCALRAANPRTCASCLQTQMELAKSAAEGPHTVTCSAGLAETAVPVRLGQRLVGFLQTGQVFRHAPTAEQFERTARLFEPGPGRVSKTRLREAYFSTPVLTAQRYDSVVRLLTIFADHLGLMLNQLALSQKRAEPAAIVRARQFIQEHHAERLSLGQVARAVNTSPCYFCKLFKRVTGLNFTEYVSRVRVEEARGLLLDLNHRVSEIAYRVGFQSLTHFNRVFKKLMGQSPTEYRMHAQCS
jgi:AraC-like DNA-binding protein/ligand-binding sensor protein